LPLEKSHDVQTQDGEKQGSQQTDPAESTNRFQDVDIGRSNVVGTAMLRSSPSAKLSLP
jgi:hypothetical protein